MHPTQTSITACYTDARPFARPRGQRKEWNEEFITCPLRAGQPESRQCYRCLACIRTAGSRGELGAGWFALVETRSTGRPHRAPQELLVAEGRNTDQWAKHRHTALTNRANTMEKQWDQGFKMYCTDHCYSGFTLMHDCIFYLSFFLFLFADAVF